ncbi:hypothetical protein Leryth_015410 [Lithospermum erythrorhizon]|nr:hypothetical protein Leryth_015410 [Lithospermum erythrorhizon]
MAVLTFSPLVFVLLLLFSFSEAREFLLNGKPNSWTIPSSPDEFTKWAEKLRFQTGDTLVVEYDPKSDSIMEVTIDDYKNCNKSNPIKSYQDGKTKIVFNRSGWFYFISGADGHCEKGQKIFVYVLHAKNGSNGPSPSPSSSPSTSPSGQVGGTPTSTPSNIEPTSDALGLGTTFAIYMGGLSSFLVMVISGRV